jgi:hypothetical protein
VVDQVTGEASGLKVLAGSDLLAIQQPAVPTATLDCEDRGSELAIRNTGNSNIQLVNGRACNEGQRAEECAEPPPTRLYAGNEIVVSEQAGQMVTHDLIVTGKSTRQVFKR